MWSFILPLHSALVLHSGTTPYHAVSTLVTVTRRSGRAVAYVEGDKPDLSRVQWLKSENGLSFKELTLGSGAAPKSAQTVAVAYKASYLSSGEVIEETARSRPLEFTLGSDSLPMFQEATKGMAVGGTRRVLLPPSSSKYSSLADETVQFDVELVALKTPPEAALFKLQSALGANRNLFRLAFVATFLPDILKVLGVLPPDVPSGSTSLAQAGDVAAAVASHPVVLDAANRWAESAASLFP